MWSLRRLGWGSMLGVLSVCSALADAAPPFLAADTRDTQKLVADRTGFFRDIYQLDDASLKRLTDWLSSQAPLHDRYQAEVHKTSYRINLAMTIVRADSNLQEADRAERLNALQAQLARLLSRGPLSLANVMKTAESGMAADKVAAAHQRLQARLASQMKGGSIDLATVDALLVTPATTITKLDASPGTPARPVATMEQPTHTDADGHNHSHAPTPTPPVAGTAQTTSPRPQPVQPPVNPIQVKPTPAPPPPPPKVYPPAPPEAEWSAYTMKTSDKFGFTPDQKRAALNALKHCRDRASAHRDEKKAAYEEAAKLADPKAKTQKLTDLNKTLDGLYDELVQRIDNIASIEQKNKVANPPATTQKS